MGGESKTIRKARVNKLIFRKKKLRSDFQPEKKTIVSVETDNVNGGGGGGVKE